MNSIKRVNEGSERKASFEKSRIEAALLGELNLLSWNVGSVLY
jgi:hypothetical protein